MLETRKYPDDILNPTAGLIFLLLLYLTVMLCFAPSAKADTRQVTQWRPFLEWFAANDSWSDNPFDLVASVTFSHSETDTSHTTKMFYDGSNTWKWRFSGTLAGTWIYLTTSADPELDGLSGTITVTAGEGDGFYRKLSGDKWGWTGTNRAVIPNYVMLQTAPSSWDTDEEIDILIDEFIVGHGFSGFHVPELAAYWFDKDADNNRFSNNPGLNSSDTSPDPETFAALEKLIQRTHAAGGAVHIWLWGDSSRSQNLTVPAMNNGGGANGIVDNRLQRYIAARLGPIAGWSLGYGFDLFEWTDESMLTTWANFLNGQFGWNHFLGARGRKNRIADSQISESLDYSAYEQHAHLFGFNDWVDTHQDRLLKPSFTEDRFRIRNEGREKDLLQDGSDTRTLLWDLTMAGGIAAIWGNLYDDAGAEVSSPYPNKHQLKTHGTFWHDKGYFRADLNVNQNLSMDDNTRILVNDEKTHWVLYRRNCDTMDIDLSSAPGVLAALAVDTKKSYAEISLGGLNPVHQSIVLPSNSDWAIRLTTEEDPTPPKQRKICVPIKSLNSRLVLICL